MGFLGDGMRIDEVQRCFRWLSSPPPASGGLSTGSVCPPRPRLHQCPPVARPPALPHRARAEGSSRAVGSDGSPFSTGKSSASHGRWPLHSGSRLAGQVLVLQLRWRPASLRRDGAPGEPWSGLRLPDRGLPAGLDHILRKSLELLALLASNGRATRPSSNCTTPRRLSLRHRVCVASKAPEGAGRQGTPKGCDLPSCR